MEASVSGRCWRLTVGSLVLGVSGFTAWGSAEVDHVQEHWAFQPLVRPESPPAADWSRSPIDDFIWARLDSVGLRPGQDAERLDLIRRASFVLVGLPPSPEEAKAFVLDSRHGAFERIVDRLIDSPQFGERWGRHWLDLARYADSNGLDENFLFREAWRYRNWVIDAVNVDMPFDRFVLEQIAGDLLPFETIEQRDRQRIAAGFLVIGPKVLLGNDPPRQRMEVADEQLDTIGKALLGQSLGCARCHDHKFDPVPTADYYALAGILTSTQVMETRYMLGEQRLMEQLVGLGSDGDELDARYENYWRELPKARESAARARSALELLKSGDSEGLAALLASHPEALSEAARDECRSAEERAASQTEWVAHLEQVLKNPPAIPPRAMVPADVERPGDESIRIGGQFDRIGRSVPRGFLRAMSSGGGIRIPEGRSGRLELGEWLTDVERGAGATTARVLVNRLWHHVMGRGIVSTADNFGRTGDEPSHPELLEYLAIELVDSGWSIRRLIRAMVLSRTFRLSSRYDAEAAVVDPENILLWRAHARRLDPESLRDFMLAAAGTLDLARRDSTVAYLGDQATAVGKNEVRRRTDYTCRSVYLPVIRNDLPELFGVFDFADPHATTGARPETIGAMQGLFLLNDEMVMQAADAAALRVLRMEGHGVDAGRMERVFELILGYSPNEEDLREMLEFVKDAQIRLADEGHEDPEVGAWSLACHAMFAMSRFQFLD